MALRKQHNWTQQQRAERIGVVRPLLDGMILKYEARRWQTVPTGERK
ncbi:MAG: hypothetical protein M3Z85_16445 [Acidobacteriota bacterium]|nr:hypothetical protein [Acidobacteriota bacterium]